MLTTQWFLAFAIAVILGAIVIFAPSLLGQLMQGF